MRHCLLHVGHHPSCHISSCLGFRLHPHGFGLHPDCFLTVLLTGLLWHQQSERWYFRAGSALLQCRLMSYHTEVCAFRHGDGYWANWRRVGFHQEEGRLGKQGRGWNVNINIPKLLHIYRELFLSVSACTVDTCGYRGSLWQLAPRPVHGWILIVCFWRLDHQFRVALGRRGTRVSRAERGKVTIIEPFLPNNNM